LKSQNNYTDEDSGERFLQAIGYGESKDIENMPAIFNTSSDSSNKNNDAVVDLTHPSIVDDSGVDLSFSSKYLSFSFEDTERAPQKTSPILCFRFQKS